MFIVKRNNDVYKNRQVPDIFNNNDKSIHEKLMLVFNFHYKIEESLQECLSNLMMFNPTYMSIFSGLNIEELTIYNNYNLSISDKPIIRLITDKIVNHFDRYINTIKIQNTNYSKFMDLVNTRNLYPTFEISIKVPSIDVFTNIYKQIENDIYHYIKIEDYYIVRVPIFTKYITDINKEYKYQLI